MSGHTGFEHDQTGFEHNQTGTEHHRHDHTPGDSPEAPKHRFGTSTVTEKTVAFLTAKLPSKTSRIVAAATVGALVLGGA